MRQPKIAGTQHLEKNEIFQAKFGLLFAKFVCTFAKHRGAQIKDFLFSARKWVQMLMKMHDPGVNFHQLIGSKCKYTALKSSVSPT